MDEYSDFQMAVPPSIESTNNNNDMDFLSISGDPIGFVPAIRPPSRFQNHKSPMLRPPPGQLPKPFAVTTPVQQKPVVGGVGGRLANYNLSNKKQNDTSSLSQSQVFNNFASPPQAQPQSNGRIQQTAGQSLLIGEEDKYAALRALVSLDNEIPIPQPQPLASQNIATTPATFNFNNGTSNETNQTSNGALKEDDDDFSDFGDFQSFTSPSNVSAISQIQSQNYQSTSSTTEDGEISFLGTSVGNSEIVIPKSSFKENALSLLDLNDIIVSSINRAPSLSLLSPKKELTVSEKEMQLAKELNEIWVMPIAAPATTNNVNLNNGSDASSSITDDNGRSSSGCGTNGDFQTFISFDRNTSTSPSWGDQPSNAFVSPNANTSDFRSPNESFVDVDGGSNNTSMPSKGLSSVLQSPVHLNMIRNDPTSSPIITKSAHLSPLFPARVNLSHNNIHDISSTIGGIKSESDILEYHNTPFEKGKSDISPETRSIASLDLGNCYSIVDSNETKTAFVPEIWNPNSSQPPELDDSFDFDELRKDDDRIVDVVLPKSVSELDLDPTTYENEQCYPNLQHLANAFICMKSIKHLFLEAIPLFSTVSKAVILEITRYEEGKNYVSSLLEIYKVFCRLQFSCQKHDSKIEGIKQLFDDIQNAWATLVTYFMETNILKKLTFEELKKN